jgi:glutathionylspermidine synthase
VDNRIYETDPVRFGALKTMGLHWFANGENIDYLSAAFLRVLPGEADALQDATASVYPLFLEAVKKVADEDLWADLKIPARALPLLKYSIQRELHLHLVGRFDFAGGLEELPFPKLLEFNADTCSLMPETSMIQETHWNDEKENIPGDPFNELLPSLVKRFEHILDSYPDKSGSLLLSTMGYEEDELNVDVIAKAAELAGFEDIQIRNLDEVIFAKDDGIYVEFGEEDFRRYDFWYKMVPWDFILFEEPELFDILDNLIQQEKAIVLNPAVTMLMQNKGLLKVIYDLAPDNKYLLKAAFSPDAFPNNKYVKKPFIGRMGENITMYDGDEKPVYETEGDYGTAPCVYQELTRLNFDYEGYRYQPSVFWTDGPSAFCFRRQDDLIVDDDAEFISHVVGLQP